MVGSFSAFFFRHKAPTLVQLERQHNQLVQQLEEIQEKLVSKDA